MRATIVRGVAYFSYTPLIGLAAVVTFGKLIAYAGLVDVGQFGSLGKMLLVSAVFGLGGNLGLQSVASRDLPALLARGRSRRGMRLLAQTVAVTTAIGLVCALAALAGLSLFKLTAQELVLGLPLVTRTTCFSYFIKYARKPQAFKPGEEWHPFEAKPGETWRSGANSDMIWLWPNIRLGPIRNTACSTIWCGYRNIVGAYCEAKWSSA